MGKLDGKIAVITGGTSGIGLAAAKRFVDEGAYVFITGRRATELAAATRQLGANVTAVQSDVANLADLDKLFAVVKQTKGRIDVLFANAGIAESAPLGAITEAHFDRQFDINVKGTLFTVQKALPLLTERSVYSATKAALRSFARTWTSDLKQRKIRVNVVSPGPTDTPALEALYQRDSASIARQVADRVPLGRIGTPDDIAKVVVFLASEDSAYITGAELGVDGGLGQV
jgi:NAD(P)-dependent dehydrogenase (short-subunit alcohol dehydrogenase family)